jgi:hypothetical protein
MQHLRNMLTYEIVRWNSLLREGVSFIHKADVAFLEIWTWNHHCDLPNIHFRREGGCSQCVCVYCTKQGMHARLCPMEPWGLEPYDAHVMSAAESQLALAHKFTYYACLCIDLVINIWRWHRVIIPDRAEPGLDGISWGKTCEGAPAGSRRFEEGFYSASGEATRTVFIFYMSTAHCCLLLV